MISIASALLVASTMAGNLDSLYSAGFEQFNCPDGRLGTSQLTWRPSTPPPPLTVDVTQYANIWGRTSPDDTIVPFPGDNIQVYFVMNRNYYLAAQFVVPANISPTTIGGFTHGETIPGPAMDMAISSQCGNFSPADQFCAKLNTGTGQPMVRWKIAGASGAQCALTPGQTYYVNVRLTNPNVSDPLDCGTPGDPDYHLCAASIANNVTP